MTPRAPSRFMADPRREPGARADARGAQIDDRREPRSPRRGARARAGVPRHGEAERLIRVIEVRIAGKRPSPRSIAFIRWPICTRTTSIDRPSRSGLWPRGRGRSWQRVHPRERRASRSGGRGWMASGLGLYDEQINRLREEAPDGVLDLAMRTAQIYELHLEGGACHRASEARARGGPWPRRSHSFARSALRRDRKWPELMDILARDRRRDERRWILELQYRLGYVAHQRQGHRPSGGSVPRHSRSRPEHPTRWRLSKRSSSRGCEGARIGEFLEPYRMQSSGRSCSTSTSTCSSTRRIRERITLMHHAARSPKSACSRPIARRSGCSARFSKSRRTGDPP